MIHLWFLHEGCFYIALDLCLNKRLAIQNAMFVFEINCAKGFSPLNANVPSCVFSQAIGFPIPQGQVGKGILGGMQICSKDFFLLARTFQKKPLSNYENFLMSNSTHAKQVKILYGNNESECIFVFTYKGVICISFLKK